MHSSLELLKMGYKHLQAKELILAVLHVHHVSRTLNTVPAGNGMQLQSGVQSCSQTHQRGRGVHQFSGSKPLKEINAGKGWSGVGKLPKIEFVSHSRSDEQEGTGGRICVPSRVCSEFAWNCRLTTLAFMYSTGASGADSRHPKL